MQNTDTIPLVSAVIVSYRGGDMLRKCLEALAAQDYQSLEVIVVDNGSGKDLAQDFSDTHPSFRWATEPTNLGFAGGCNRGIKEAAGEMIALINDDAMISPSWTSEMVKCMRENPKIGAIAGLVIDGNRPEVLDSFGVGVAIDGMSRQLQCGASSSAPREPIDVLAFSGCSCLIRKLALDDAGLFDERFFAYCEDTDLSLRLIRNGWTIKACPTATSLHHYSHTGGKFSLQKLYLIERNHHWVAIRNFPLLLLLFLPLANIWRMLVQLCAMAKPDTPVKGFASNGLMRVALTLLRANVSAAVHIPAMLLDRLFAATGSSKGLTSRLLKEGMTIREIFLASSGSAPKA